MENYISLPKNKLLKSEIEISKSRFLGFAKNVDSVVEAMEFVKEIKRKYNDARHICYAYRLFDASKSTDDGEPSGTAGKPILEYLTHKNLYQVVLVIVRYFGGIKLGTGGLVRAYTGCADATINNSFVEYKQVKVYTFCTNYAQYQVLLSWAKQNSAKLIDVEFGENITGRVLLYEDNLPPVKCEYMNTLFDSVEE